MGNKVSIFISTWKDDLRNTKVKFVEILDKFIYSNSFVILLFSLAFYYHSCRVKAIRPIRSLLLLLFDHVPDDIRAR